MKDEREIIKLEAEELEERIAPGGFGPSNNGNPGNEVSNGAKPHPSGGNGNWCIGTWWPAQSALPHLANTPGSEWSRGWHGRMNRKAPAGSFLLILKAGKTQR
jgi:hypothetical protein